MLYGFLTAALFFIITVNCYDSYSFVVKGNSLNGYYISSLIGTPPQRIELNLDTGSSNLAIAASVLENVNSYFKYNNSLSFRSTNVTVREQYEKGNWTGFLGLDIVNPCLETNCGVTCNISLITSSKDLFENHSMYQGILGLAYPSIANPDSSVQPFLNVFFIERNVSKVFAMSLCGPFYNSKESSTRCGELHIGYYSQSLSIDGIRFTPIAYEKFYEVTVVSLKVGTASAPVDCEELNRNKSIVDSGSTNLNVPPVIYRWMLSEIKNYVRDSIPYDSWFDDNLICMENESLDLSVFPTLTLSLLHSSDYYFNLQVSPELYMLSIINHSCAMIAIDTSMNGIVIGSSLLKGFYVVFDRENKQIGFGLPKKLQNLTPGSEVSDLQVSSFYLDHCKRKDSGLSDELSYIYAFVFISVMSIFFYFILWLIKYDIKRRLKVDIQLLTSLKLTVEAIQRRLKANPDSINLTLEET